MVARARRRLNSIEPVWWLNAFIGAAAVVLYLTWIRHLDPILGPDVGWWWVLGIMVFVTERWPVQLEFRRGTHSFSLTDVPLTLALIFTSGTHAFVAVMAGALVALLLRRAPAVKFAFNLAQFALVTSVLIVVVHLAASTDPGFGWITWAAVLAASQMGSVLTTAQILAAIVLTEGYVSRDQVRQMFGLDQAVTIVGTAMALVCGVVWIERPEAMPLLLIPILIASVGYRAYVLEREGHEKVKTPLRGEPNPVRIARGRRRARGPARTGARGLPRRAGRGRPVRCRRWRAVAHQPRPGHRPRGDGAARRSGGQRPPHIRRGLRRRGRTAGTVPGDA